MKPFDYIKQLINESYRIILHPGIHWRRVKDSNDLLDGGWLKFYVPGILIVFFAVILGDLLFESEYGFLFVDTLIKASRKVLLIALVLLASNILIFEVSRGFHIPLSSDDARKISSYSLLPLVLIYTVTGLFPFMDIIGILGFYSLFLVYNALTTLYEINFNRNTTYVIILLSSLFLAFAFIGFLLSKLTALIIY